MYEEILCNYMYLRKYYEKTNLKEVYIHVCPKNKFKILLINK